MGTGEMISALKNGEVDVVVALTEGLVKDITTSDSPIRLLGTYVESPLCWAISTAGSNPRYECVADLQGQKIAVSRMTSGSHLMSCVLATQRGWKQEDLEYVVCGNIDKLRASVNNHETAAFMWETFTTKPYHDSGDLTRIGEITTPWPCFMIASTLDVVEKKTEELRGMFEGIREGCRIFGEERDVFPSVIAKEYNLKPEDARQWYNGVKISATAGIGASALETVVSALQAAHVLSEDYSVNFTDIIDVRFAHLVSDIKTMRLYNKPELISVLYNTLKEESLLVGPVNYADLTPYDQNHYRGLEALEICKQECQIGEATKMINIGSNLGGPSRYFAGKYGAEVTAVELQADLSNVAQEITARCGPELVRKIDFKTGDYLQVAPTLPADSYDVVTSWLTLLHFDKEKRLELLNKSWKLMKSGGRFFVEDFFANQLAGELSTDERHILEKDVFCHYLPTLSQYIEDIQLCGFSVQKIENLSADWQDFTLTRLATHQRAREKYTRIHGADTYNRLSYFYGKIATLLASGKVGGIRLVAVKP
eukprot:CAMPEP_0201519790 /NCGR_PEP_ID=MMETSP0161_2-20130828/10248_1 /ASSEMBLY_ACC=CAM_ASM_000251 /TAXON_ID=180227 /ORGANISM="Neoparamoeba aestuarina, Strain SoJaBio B1-5/56/2" /LENGTH=538 /DNA_ID=CAMNT_0047917941 /DNA_START=205 /DNA_END=1821 /DNA_ORIENTATION=-